MDDASLCYNISLFYNGKIIALDKPDKIVEKSGEKNMQDAFINLIKKARQEE